MVFRCAFGKKLGGKGAQQPRWWKTVHAFSLSMTSAPRMGASLHDASEGTCVSKHMSTADTHRRIVFSHSLENCRDCVTLYILLSFILLGGYFLPQKKNSKKLRFK